MYTQYYQLQRLPFENTPDPRCFFASEQHREALAAIEYVIRMRKGYVLVTGDIGSGKTTVGRIMLERCGRSAQIVGVLHGHDSPEQMLHQVLLSLGVRANANEPRPSLLSRLHVKLEAGLAQQRPVVLYVDEAQTLSDATLEELRLLSNFDTDRQKLAQVVLIGQPELRQRIREPQFAALRQRIVLAKQLHPLNHTDTESYILHRLRSASENPQALGLNFSPGAIQEVFNHSRGIPRLINFTCDNCLLLGFVQQTRQITRSMVLRVIADMVPSFGQNDASISDSNLALAGNF